MEISDTSSQDIALEPKTGKSKILLSSGLLVILVAAGWIAAPTVKRWSMAQESVSSERLRTALVSRGNFVRDISVQGRVVAAISPTLYATQTGTITFEVESGDRVHSGEVLATIESPETQNQL